MPNLRKLVLRNIIVCAELREFVLCHLDTLEHVELHECYANDSGGDHEPDRIIWRTLFMELTQALARRKTQGLHTRLAQFEISFDKPELGKHYLEFTDSRLVARGREKVKTEPGARVFFYCRVDDKYGIRSADDTATLEHFLQGHDEECFRALLAAIENAHGVR